MIQKQLITIGVSGAISVSLGALGAHALKNQLPGGLITPDQLNGFDTAVKYQMYHTLAMFLVVILNKDLQNKFLKQAYRLFYLGIIMFSGSLYLLCTRNLLGTDGLKILGPITPIGGILFVAGWVMLIFAAVIKNRNTTS
jgi:uncharacterized membrane protein YgdD (TMEM256/DUF423 family)